MKNRWKQIEVADGSITIFLSFLSVILMALVGTALDSARYFSSGGYVSISAHAAGMTVFGEYNRELYQEYRMLGYGGYHGECTEEVRQEFVHLLSNNLNFAPQSTKKSYLNIYRFQNLSAEIVKPSYLNEEDIFMGQIKDWLKVSAISDITGKVLEQVREKGDGLSANTKDSLEETQQMEMEEEEATDKEVKPVNKSQNPLIYLKELVQDGVLNLVCDTESLSEEIVTKRGEEGTENENQERESEKQKKKEQTASQILKQVLADAELFAGKEMNQSLGEKTSLLLYANHFMNNYTKTSEKSMAYGLEYLIAGREKDKDNLSTIINRLFLVRTLMNYAYVKKNPILLKKSLATAMAISTVAQAGPLTKAVQEVILLVLSLEEACVDICALLEGRVVPFVKTDSSFLMKYEEICMADRNLFQKKAKNYPEEDNSFTKQSITKGFCYRHYLWLFLFLLPKEDLWNRTLDLIQDDLRKRYNNTFTINQCISRVSGKVSYEMPYVSGAFLIRNREKKAVKQRGMLCRELSFQYGYD